MSAFRKIAQDTAAPLAALRMSNPDLQACKQSVAELLAAMDRADARN